MALPIRSKYTYLLGFIQTFRAPKRLFSFVARPENKVRKVRLIVDVSVFSFSGLLRLKRCWFVFKGCRTELISVICDYFALGGLMIFLKYFSIFCLKPSGCKNLVYFSSSVELTQYQLLGCYVKCIVRVVAFFFSEVDNFQISGK